MAQLLAFASSCVGGQTTVPTSAPQSPPCEPPNITPEVERRYFGVHALDVKSVKVPLQGQLDERAIRVTVDVSPTSSTIPAAGCTLIDVAVELSSDDGSLEYSGQGKLARHSQVLQVGLAPAMGISSGTVTWSDSLKIELRYLDGTVITAQGPLPP